MHIHPSSIVGDLAAAIPGATKIFEARNIDFCCHGACSLEEACAAKGLPAGELMAELERAARGADEPNEPIDWEHEGLADLAKHIVERHHTYTRRELERLDGLSRRVLAAHGLQQPQLQTLRELFLAMSDDLLPHLAKEEIILFPFIEELETSRRAGRSRPSAPFGAVDNPIRAMMHDHDHVGEVVRRLRALTCDYHAYEGACASSKALYAGLQALDLDLHEHMRLESDVLFPRTLRLEHD